MQISFIRPDEEVMRQITSYVKEYVLDDENLSAQQFIAAMCNHTLVGFGRLRKHNECEELCTLGVIEKYRGRGIGKALVNEIKKLTNKPLYLVCIIPGFFYKLGFQITDADIPLSMKRKHERCTTEYIVEEEYCVMKFDNSSNNN